MKTQCKNIHFHLYNARRRGKVHGGVKKNFAVTFPEVGDVTANEWEML